MSASPGRSVPTPHGPAKLAVDVPARGRPGALLVLGHGAGGGVDARDLTAVRNAALPLGVAVARVTQPYRVSGRRTPPAARQLDAAWVAAVRALRAQQDLDHLPLVVGGRSSGARVACRTAAEVGAVAVLALAFPLHPPGRPDRSRVTDLECVEVPLLVVQGERDPFGAPGEFPAATDIRAVAEGDHGFGRASDLQEAAADAASWVVRFAGAPARAEGRRRGR